MMWGLMLRVTGARVEARIPGWLMNAAASHAAVAHARRVAHELSAHPDSYGFDPDATYTAFVQSWDRAELDIPSLAFGRNVAGHGTVGLWPDPYYIGSRGFHGLRRAAEAAPPWAARSSRVAWRGSVTGAGAFATPEDIPRIRLALTCHGREETDVGLIGVHPTMAASICVEETERFVATNGLGRESWPVADFGLHRFAFDIDGHANAWGLLEKLILGCCVLKVGSPFEQWYYRRLQPWIHYVPVKADLSDLWQIVDWCMGHDEQCRWIARNGARLAAALALDHELAESCRTFLTAAHPLSADLPPPAGHAGSDTIAIEDRAIRAEGDGLIGTAIDACTRLVDAGEGGREGGEALRRRSRLLCQQGDFGPALRDLERAVAVDPDDDEAQLALAKFIAPMGRDAAAAGCLEEALRRTPGLSEARIVLAASCIRLDRLDAAARAVRPLPEDVSGWWGDLRRQSIDGYAARRAQARAILRARRGASGYAIGQVWELAIALHASGRLRAAAQLCALTAAHDPASFAPHDLASRIVARREGPGAAISYLAGLPARFRNDPQYAIRHAQMLLELGAYREVLDLLHGRADVEDDFLVRRMVAHAAILLDERGVLADHCRRWMERAPGDPLPAGLVCAAQPLPDAFPPVGADRRPIEIAQFWHDEDVPASLREVMDSWSVHHPEIRRHVLHDASARAFLTAGFEDDVVRAYDRCRTPAAKASLLRCAWLGRHGGVWIAADRRCLRPAAGFLSACAGAEIATVRSGHAGSAVEDAIVGARRGSSVAATMLRMIVARTEDDGQGDRQGEGPADLLTRVMARRLCDPHGIGDALLFAPIQARCFSVTVRRP